VTDFALRDERLLPLLTGEGAGAPIHHGACFLTSGGSEGRLIRAGLFDHQQTFSPIAVWKVLFSGFDKSVLQTGLMNEALNLIVAESDAPELVTYFRALREFCGASRAISSEDVLRAAESDCLVLERNRSEPSLRIVSADSGAVVWASEGHLYGADPLFVEAAARDWAGLLDRLGVPNVLSFEEAA